LWRRSRLNGRTPVAIQAAKCFGDGGAMASAAKVLQACRLQTDGKFCVRFVQRFGRGPVGDAGAARLLARLGARKRRPA
jgi:hypothetical protein